MSRSLRIPQPPSSGNARLDEWNREVARALNGLPPISIFSTANGPESTISATAGTLGIDIGSFNTLPYPRASLWWKASGETTVGWTSVSVI